MLIDTHCHLDFPEFDSDRAAVIARAQANGVLGFITVGAGINESIQGHALAQEYASVFFSIGFHPHYADSFHPDVFSKLESIAGSKKLVAIGEVGLDYYRNRSSPQNQKKTFLAFIEFARRLGLPLIVHSRESSADTIAILKDSLKDCNSVVIHCFSGPKEFLEECLALGAMVSFTANITYPRAELLRRLVEATPLERMMLETDAPYLAPQRFRGKRNEPSYVHEVAAQVAAIKKIPFDEVARITTQNAERFFKLGPVSEEAKQ